MDILDVSPGIKFLWYVTACILLIALGITAYMLHEFGLWGQAAKKRLEEEARDLARRTAQTPQKVRTIEKGQGVAVILHTRSATRFDEEACLVFPVRHPAYPHLEEVERWAVIRFEYRPDPLPGVDPSDATTYLTLKDSPGD